MELILIKPIRKVGKIGDQIKVKNGYGRHFLIPNKFAIRATEKNKQIFNEQRKSLEEKDHHLYLEAQNAANSLEGKELRFIRQAAEDGKLFGSVSNKEITNEISETLGVKVNVTQIYLPKLIKYTGLYNVEVRLHAEQIANVKIGVGRTETEIKEFLKEKSDKSSENKSQDTTDLSEVELRIEEGQNTDENLVDDSLNQ